MNQKKHSVLILVNLLYEVSSYTRYINWVVANSKKEETTNSSQVLSKRISEKELDFQIFFPCVEERVVFCMLFLDR